MAEFEETFKRYTLGQLMALNHGNYLTSGPLHELFDSYPPFKWGFGKDAVYNNIYNHRFSSIKGSGQFRVKKAHVYSDDSILDKIRSIFCAVTADGRNTDLIVTKLNQLNIPTTKSIEIATLFQEAMIECGSSLVDEYLKIIFTFRVSNGIEKIITKKFIERILAEFKNPSKFTDTRIEEGKSKELRWRSVNALIISKMAVSPVVGAEVRNQFTLNIIYDKFLQRMMDGISSNTPTDLLVISAVWPTLASWKQFREDGRYKLFINKLDLICADPAYPKLIKVKLLDITDV